jgi:hypothetical protein
METMTARGQDTTKADQTLRLLQETLVLWRGHRQDVLDALACGRSPARVKEPQLILNEIVRQEQYES